jgi:hypothetical protein
MSSVARVIDLTDTMFPHPHGVHLTQNGARLQRRPAPSPEYTGFLEAVLDQPRPGGSVEDRLRKRQMRRLRQSLAQLGHMSPDSEEMKELQARLEAATPPDAMRVEVASHARTLAGWNDTASLFYQGLRLAFTAHHGFAIRPEVLMYMVNAAIAETVRRHPEHYRHLFTREPATEEIKVRHDGLEPGSPDGWDQAITLFEDVLRQRVPDGIMPHMLPALSTHTAASKIASLISFMNAASSYYEYTVVTSCGIPAIRIDGTPEDYRAVTAACAGLAEQFAPHLGAYFDELLPVLDRIARQAAGEERDVDFWQSMYKYESRSGSATMDGWATVFLADWKLRDGSLVPRHAHPDYQHVSNRWSPVPSDAVPQHVSTVPFLWVYYGTPYRMELAGGILGLGNDGDFVTPELGWAVIHARG